MVIASAASATAAAREAGVKRNVLMIPTAATGATMTRRNAIAAAPRRVAAASRIEAVVGEITGQVRIVVRVAIDHRAPSLPHFTHRPEILLAGAEAGRLVVIELRERREHDAVAGASEAQAVVDVVEVNRKPFVEATDLVEHLAPRHQARPGDRRV